MKIKLSQPLFAVGVSRDIGENMIRHSRSNSQQKNGFTLVEMMVALFVFSILSVAGVLLLRSAVDSNEVTDRNLRGVADMQRLVSLLETDLSQALPRTYRDGDGERRAAFESDIGTNGNMFLVFTRGGQSNINDKARSNIHRVSYRLRDGQLERLQHEMTDGGAISEPAELIDGVENLELRFRDRRGQWRRDWQTERLNDLPRAIEINFTQDGRSYRHLFLVGTGYL